MHYTRGLGAEPDLIRLAAQALIAFVGCLGTLLALVSGGQLWLSSIDAGAAMARLVTGLVFMVFAGAGFLLLQRGRYRSASLLMLVAATLGGGIVAAAVGVGLNGVAVPGIAVLIIFAGVVASRRAVTLIAVLYALVVLVLAAAEADGWLPGVAALPRLGLGDRVGNLLLLGGGAWIAAQVAHRMVSSALREAITGSQRLSALVRLGSDWAWEKDGAGRMRWLDGSFEARTGQSVADFMRLDEPGGPQALRDAEWQAMADDERARRAYRGRLISYRCPDGSLLHVNTSGEPTADDQGRFNGWWGVGRNVTEEVKARQARQREQAMLDRLVRMSPDALCVARVADARILLANQSFLDLAGMPEAAVRGRNPVDIGLWRDPAEAARLRDALRAGGSVRDLRSEVWSFDGQRHEVLITAAVFEWDDEPVAVITTRDITDVERVRRETEAILDHASVGIALVRDGRFRRVNPLFETLYGHAPGTLAGQPAGLMFPPGNGFETFDEPTDTGTRPRPTGPIDFEHEVFRPDGSRVLLRMRARAVDSRHPREAGMIWVIEDVGPRRAAERELADAKHQADRANQAKSAFLATMSHEIRTPLNGVLGLARLLQDPDLQADRRAEYLAHLVTAAEGLAGIVSDVLDLSKIEAGQFLLESIDFDLRELVASTFNTFAPLGHERGLAMRSRIDAALPPRVRGDPVRVRQILANFLSNAIKFTTSGHIEVQARQLDGKRVRLSVDDSGPGIPHDIQPRLFRPFAQADSSTTRRFGGTGLGLSICRELAERMGGCVGVDSSPGEGSHFWADLDLPGVDPAGTGTAAASDDAPLAGMQVLVAEDHPVNMLIVCSMLRQLGVDVLEATDGEQAVDVAREHVATLHAVLMDLHMPIVDGLAAARQLRADPLTAALPILALSAAVLEHDRDLARDAGMQDFVAKPVEEAELLRALSPLRPVAAQ